MTQSPDASPSSVKSPPEDATQSIPPTLHGTAGKAPTAADDRTLAFSLAESAGIERSARVGDYELLEEIARGGMGIVYKARQISLNRIVAVKTILAGRLATEDDVHRFNAEAVAAATLRHPGIVPIYDVGQEDGQHYFSMAYLPGDSLATKVSQGPLAPSEAARLTQRVAEAVAYAHRQGLIHRDLKPSNILLDADGMPQVTDFGLAKRLSADSHLTASGQVLGTPSYMPPEQASGDLQSVSPLSDVYSLGAILYTLLTGRPPFQAANSVDTLLQVLQRDPAPPRQLNRDVPHDLETISLKCLEKEPKRRYASADEVARELQRFLEGRPILARPLHWPQRALRWSRRKPGVASLLAGIALSWLLGTAFCTYFAVLAHRRAGDALANLHRAEVAERDATEKLRGAYLAQARASRWSGRAGQRFDGLDALRKAAAIRPDLAMRNEAIACLALPDLRRRETWQGWPTGVTAVAADPTLSYYARSEADGEITVRRMAQEAPVATLAGATQPAWVLVFSPDGKWLAAKHHHQERRDENVVRVWNWRDQRLAFELSPGVQDMAIAFRPDGRSLAAGLSDGRIVARSLSDNDQQTEFAGERLAYALRFDPAGGRLASSSLNRKDVHIHDAQSGRLVAEVPLPAPARGLAWTSDGQRLACAGADGAIHVWDGASLRSTRLGEDDAGVATSVAFDSRGRLLVSAGWDGQLRLWNADNLRLIVKGEGGAIACTFGPKGDRLGLTREGKLLATWDVAAGDEFESLPGVRARWAADFSPDGRWLAVANDEGAQLFDTHGKHAPLRLPIAHCRWVKFHPNGASVFTSSSGIQRWPVKSTGAGRSFVLGAPENLGLPGAFDNCALSRDGSALAATHATGCYALRLAEPEKLIRLAPHAKAAFIDLSPTGRWVATGAWQGTGVQVCDAQSGRLVKKLSVEGNASVAFSPDGVWLVTGSSHEYAFWDTVEWRRRHVLARERSGDFYGEMAFNNDGSLLAVAHTRTLTKLIEPATGRELATLDAGPQHPACFDRSGERLAVVGPGQQAQIWNLRLVRRRLSAMNLDW